MFFCRVSYVFSNYGYRSVVCVFVSLSITFVHCAQMAEDIDRISSASDNSMSLPYRVKTQLTSVNTFLPK